MSVLEWRAAIGCDGGPVIVANAADFAHWTGGTPLPKAERRELHLWSPFTHDLPETFLPNGPTGHQYVPAADHDELERLRDELIAYVARR